MHKIAMIIPYFGKWPEWFDLYLLSCSKQNSCIDYYFFTDCIIPEIKYENTFFSSISFDSYCQLVSEKLKIKFHPNNRYKLTDLKPFLGIVHEELISKYSYWAFGDIDLVYGNMEGFLCPLFEGKYDLITTHADRIAGHFTAMKTLSTYTTLCLKIHDWQRLLEEEQHNNLDEGAFSLLVAPYLRYILKLCRFFGDKFYRNNHRHICNIIAPLFSNPFTKRYFRELNTTPIPTDDVFFEYDVATGSINGSNGSALPYLHFLFFKQTPYLRSDRFWIPKSFYNLGRVEGKVRIDIDGIKQR